MRLKRTIIILLLLVLSGCASKTPVDVGTYHQTASGQKAPLGKIEIINKAKKYDQHYGGLFNDSVMWLEDQIEPKTEKTVESDLRTYFSDKFYIDKASLKSLSVTIYDASSYWIYPGEAQIPFVGLLVAVATDETEFGMKLHILFEVENNGKVASTYSYDTTVKYMANSYGDLQESYGGLVVKYRSELFGELDDRFISRYF